MIRSQTLVWTGLAAALFFGCTQPVTKSKKSCSINSDCVSGLICVSKMCIDLSAPKCDAEDRCESFIDCPSQVCEDGCCAGACVVDRDCDVLRVCESGACQTPTSSDCHAEADCRNHVGPHCDLRTGVCARCVETSQCPSGLTCVNFGCREPPETTCVSDGECPSGFPRCFTDELRCVPCLANEDCSDDGSSVCDPATHSCHRPKEGCDADADCENKPDASHCRVSDHTCVACLQNAQCGSGERCLSDNSCGGLSTCAAKADCSAPLDECNVATRTCVECLEDADCGSGSSCVKNQCATTRCSSDADCSPAAPRCDSTTKTCIECIEHADCPAGLTCAGYECVGCTSSNDCVGVTGRPSCNTATKLCVECLSDDQCGTAQRCTLNACVTVGVDQRCPSSGICPSGMACAGGFCRATCDLTAASPGCASGRRCGVGATDSFGAVVGTCLPSNGGAQYGASCTGLINCDVNLACVSESGGKTCRKLCDPTQSTAACTSPGICKNVTVNAASGATVPYGGCAQ